MYFSFKKPGAHLNLSDCGRSWNFGISLSSHIYQLCDLSKFSSPSGPQFPHLSDGQDHILVRCNGTVPGRVLCA